METRSSRYLDENISTRPKSSRTSKNRYLYDEVNKNIGYEEIDSLSGYGDFEFDKETPIKSREEYQQREKALVDEKVVVDSDNDLSKEKVYDINSVLEEAKKNRVIPDEMEKRRNLQNAEYNILADLNKKYMTKKEQIEEDLEREGIRELIDTITSRNLAKELNLEEDDDGKDLMSDLMATNTGIAAINEINLEEEIAKEILAEKDNGKDDDEIIKDDGNLVNSFYTKSMDLTEQDFELRDEIGEENKEKRKILILVVLIVLVIIAIVGILILKKINII